MVQTLGSLGDICVKHDIHEDSGTMPVPLSGRVHVAAAQMNLERA